MHNWLIGAKDLLVLWLLKDLVWSEKQESDPEYMQLICTSQGGRNEEGKVFLTEETVHAKALWQKQALSEWHTEIISVCLKERKQRGSRKQDAEAGIQRIQILTDCHSAWGYDLFLLKVVNIAESFNLRGSWCDH